MLEELTVETVRRARERIAGHVLRTPLMPYRLNDECELLLKPESLQSVGAFKIRGAFSVMTTLTAGCPGVVAHSSGNHAQAVARAGRVLGINTLIVMPSNAPPLKRRRAEADGARIVTVGPDSHERAQKAAELAETENLVPVVPYDDPLVASGQGTAALEMLEDAGRLDRFYCPISGGGLMAGCATVVSALSPSTEIIGVEPEDGNDTKLSLEAGKRIAVDPPSTIADGLRVRMPGERTFPVVRKHVSRIELVTDEELLDSMAFALRELRLVLEPSGAASLAVALREGRGRCGVLLSGGNVDPTLLADVARRNAQ
jgi:threonine dehydratase